MPAGATTAASRSASGAAGERVPCGYPSGWKKWRTGRDSGAVARNLQRLAARLRVVALRDAAVEVDPWCVAARRAYRQRGQRGEILGGRTQLLGAARRVRLGAEQQREAIAELAQQPARPTIGAAQRRI